MQVSSDTLNAALFAPALLVPRKKPVNAQLKLKSQYAKSSSFWLFDKRWAYVPDISKKNSGRIDNSDSDVTWGLSDTSNLTIEFAGDATNDRVDLGSITADNFLSLAGSSYFCIAGKIRVDSGGTSNFQRIIDKSNGGNGTNGWSLIADMSASAERLHFLIGGAAGQESNSSTSSISYGAWFTFVMNRVSATHFVWYINNALDNDHTGTTGDTIPSTTVSAAIGNWNHSTDRMLQGGIEWLFLKNGYNFSAAEARQAFYDPYNLFLEPVGNSLLTVPSGAVASTTSRLTLLGVG